MRCINKHHTLNDYAFYTELCKSWSHKILTKICMKRRSFVIQPIAGRGSSIAAFNICNNVKFFLKQMTIKEL
jgi:hypothetical protein